MKKEYKNRKFYCAVISHKRPENVQKMLNMVGMCTFYVNKGEGQKYQDAGADSVVECGDNICDARNRAIMDAGSLPCIQVSDDLRGIKLVRMSGKNRVQTDLSFFNAVLILIEELSKKKFLFGGVAVTNNALNYTGEDFSYDKLVVNDLICIMPSKEPQLFDVSVALKEDYEMCIRQLVYVGGLVRCNHILCNFPHRENKGGANTYRNSKTEKEATKKLLDKWGPCIKDHSTREGQISLNYKTIELLRQNYLNNK